MEKANEVLVANLAARLTELDWAVADLARATNLSTGGLYGIVHGRRWPSPDNLDRIAAALGKEPWELLCPSKPHSHTELENELVRAIEGMDDADLRTLLTIAKRMNPKALKIGGGDSG